MFWFLLPFRAKNPPEHFPWVTIALIVINTFVYAITADPNSAFLQVSEGSLRALAVSHSTLSPWRLITAMFLHGSPLHLAGNMLFLWIFGAPVEGRLRPLKFIALYLFAGICGGLLSDLVQGLVNPDVPNLGASGAIMGLAGAYFYIFPMSSIRLVWLVWIFLYLRAGVTDWQARWVILLFFGLDVFNGLVSRGGDGVGHFAHIGGALLGFLFALLLRVPQDSEEASAAQAVQADMRDYSLLSFQELSGLMQRPTEDPRLVLAYCEKAFLAPGTMGEAHCLAALQHYGRLLIERADPVALSACALRLSLPNAGRLPLPFYLRLGSQLERAGASDPALRTYRRVCELAPASPDAEAAWLRAGRLLESGFGDPVQAAACYSQLLQRFPDGAMSLDARCALDALRRNGRLAENVHWKAAETPPAAPPPPVAVPGRGRDLSGDPLP